MATLHPIAIARDETARATNVGARRSELNARRRSVTVVSASHAFVDSSHHRRLPMAPWRHRCPRSAAFSRSVRLVEPGSCKAANPPVLPRRVALYVPGEVGSSKSTHSRSRGCDRNRTVRVNGRRSSRPMEETRPAARRRTQLNRAQEEGEFDSLASTPFVSVSPSSSCTVDKKWRKPAFAIGPRDVPGGSLGRRRPGSCRTVGGDMLETDTRGTHRVAKHEPDLVMYPDP